MVERVKIVFPLDPSEWHQTATESLWAMPMKEGVYRLDNIPFYAKGVSYGDLVSTEQKGSQLMYKKTAKSGGHSTYRILVDPEMDKSKFDKYWMPIQKLGSTYELKEGKMDLYAVDVPPETSVDEVYKLLDKGEKDGAWGFEEGHCGHLGK